MKHITRDDIELSVMRYYSQQRIDVFNKAAPGLSKNNFELLLFSQLESWDAIGLRHIFRVVGTEQLIHEYPQDWWQMLKARWFPRWLIRLLPIKNNQVVANHIFPFCQEELGKEVVKITVRKKEYDKK